VGTRLALARDGRSFTLEVPPARGGSWAMGGFATIWLGFVAFWTFSAVAMGAPIFFPLFSIPFWLVGFGMVGTIWRNRTVKAHLRIDRDAWQLERSGVRRRRVVGHGKTRDLMGFTTDVPVRVNGKPVYRLVLQEGARDHKVASPIEPVEAEWLRQELAAFLGHAR
jgi:hypothetical protein